MVKSFRNLLGVPPSTVSTDDSVLLIIDAQNEYINGQLATSNIDSTRKAISTLLEKYRAAKAPVVHIVHIVPSGAPIFTPETPLAAVFDELTPKDGEKIVEKTAPGSFWKTDLEEFIKGTGRNKLVLVGYMAHVCVSTTARQAAERGYEVVVVRDGVGDRDIPGVDAATLVNVVLAELADVFATVVGIEDVK